MTVTLTEEQFTRLMTQLGGGGDAAGRKGIKKLLDDRDFRRMDVFIGKDCDWKEWYFMLGVTMRAADNKVADKLVAVENMVLGEVTVQGLKDDMDLSGDGGG